MKVLIIDDEPLIRRALSRVFQASGHQVETAEDGRKGLESWKKFSPDLIFLDVLMPGLTGPELLQSVTHEYKQDVKIIMMSAYTGKEGDLATTTSGIDLFLRKPFEDIFSLVRIAEEVLLNGQR